MLRVGRVRRFCNVEIDSGEVRIGFYVNIFMIFEKKVLSLQRLIVQRYGCKGL